MNRDTQLLVEAYEKVVEENISSTRIPLAHRIFELLIDGASDEHLTSAARTIAEYKQQFGYGYKSLTSIPFIRDLFSIVETEFGYRTSLLQDAPAPEDGPEPESPEAGKAGNIGEVEDHFDDRGAPRV